MYVGFARPTKGMNFGNTLDWFFTFWENRVFLSVCLGKVVVLHRIPWGIVLRKPVRSMPDQGCNVAIPVSEGLICAGRGACGSIGIKEDYRESSGIPLLKRNKKLHSDKPKPPGIFPWGLCCCFFTMRLPTFWQNSWWRFGYIHAIMGLGSTKTFKKQRNIL